jgi:hypothetical protein
VIILLLNLQIVEILNDLCHYSFVTNDLCLKCRSCFVYFNSLNDNFVFQLCRFCRYFNVVSNQHDSFKRTSSSGILLVSSFFMYNCDKHEFSFY